MNTLINTQGKSMTHTHNSSKQPFYSLAPIALLLSFALINPAIATTNTGSQHEVTPKAVSNVLEETENAITSMRVNPLSSLESVEQAIKSIELIEDSYEYKTITHTDSKYNTEIANSYEHFYPRLDEETLKNINSMPTLSYKIESDIVYKGSNQDLHSTHAFFDYTFAKASLISAKHALEGDDTLEAMSNLRRVFEAVYLAPDFNVPLGDNG